MTNNIDVVRVKWGYEDSKESGLYSNRLVLEKEVKGLIDELITTHIFHKDSKGESNIYNMLSKGFYIRIDVVEPDYIDNEKIVEKE